MPTGYEHVCPQVMSVYAHSARPRDPNDATGPLRRGADLEAATCPPSSSLLLSTLELSDTKSL